jgi:hypothetical protein
MEMVPGAVIAIERFALLGDPIDAKLRGYRLSLRKKEASMVSVEVLEGSQVWGPLQRFRRSITENRDESER